MISRFLFLFVFLCSISISAQCQHFFSTSEIAMYGDLKDVKFSPDCKSVVLGTSKGLFFFDLKNFNLIRTIPIDKGILYFKFSDSGGKMIITVADTIHCYQVYDLQNDKVLSNFTAEIRWFNSYVAGRYGRDAPLINAGIIPTSLFMGHENSLLFYDNESKLAYLRNDGKIVFFDIEKNAVISEQPIDDTPVSLGFIKNTNMIVVGGIKNQIYYYDAATLQLKQIIPISKELSPERNLGDSSTLAPMLIDNEGHIGIAVQFNVTSGSIASAFLSYYVFNLSNGKLIRNLYDVFYDCESFHFMPSRLKVLNDNKILLWANHSDGNPADYYTPIIYDCKNDLITAYPTINAGYYWLDPPPMSFFVNPVSDDAKFVSALTPDGLYIWNGGNVFHNNSKINDFYMY